MFGSVFKSGIRALYNVSDTSTFTCDFWDVYPAKHKQSGNVVSVFIFNKTSFESMVNRLCSQLPNTKNPRNIIHECYDTMRLGVSQLAKMKHPQILTVIENLEETKSKLIFVTEPVVGNLKTITFGDEAETVIQKGILEIAKGLQFIHNVCDMVHLNLQPTSVLINSSGDWKISGFSFLQSIHSTSLQARENFIIMNASSVVPFANLNLEFVAPELILDSGGLRLSPANDLWSLGQLIFYLFNHGDRLIELFDTSSISDYKQSFRKFEQKFYKHSISEMQYVFKGVPKELWQTLVGALARYPIDRVNIDQFIECDYFNGSLIKTMWFVDEFSTKEVDDKILFLEGLLENNSIISQLPVSFRNNKFLPLIIASISNELSLSTSKPVDPKSNDLVAKQLHVMFILGKELSNLSFHDRVYDVLLSTKKPKKAQQSPLMTLANYSIKVRLVLIENANVLKSKLSSPDLVSLFSSLATSCLTFLPSAIDQQSDQIALQDLYLKSLALVVGDLEFTYIKCDLLPLICQVFKTTTIMSTKLQTIDTFRLLINRKILDQATIVDSIIPLFENLKSRDKRIIESVLDYSIDQIGSNIVTRLDILIEKSLSQCFRLAFACDNCSKADFERYMAKIKSMEETLTAIRVSQLSSSSGTDHHPQIPSSFDSLINSSSIAAAPRTVVAPKQTALEPNRADTSNGSKLGEYSSRTISAQSMPFQASNSTVPTLRPHAPSSTSHQTITSAMRNPSSKIDVKQDSQLTFKTSHSIDNANGARNETTKIKLPPGYSHIALKPNGTPSLSPGTFNSEEPNLL